MSSEQLPPTWFPPPPHPRACGRAVAECNAPAGDRGRSNSTGIPQRQGGPAPGTWCPGGVTSRPLQARSSDLPATGLKNAQSKPRSLPTAVVSTAVSGRTPTCYLLLIRTLTGCETRRALDRRAFMRRTRMIPRTTRIAVHSPPACASVPAVTTATEARCAGWPADSV